MWLQHKFNPLKKKKKTLHAHGHIDTPPPYAMVMW